MKKIVKKNQGFSTVDVLLAISALGVLGIFVAIESITVSLICIVLR